MSRSSSYYLDKLKNDIKTEATRLGFSHIGFTKPSTPNHADIFIEWLENGYAGTMNYLNRPDTLEKRLDPRKILASCESIIILTLPYTPASIQEEAINPKIASYAIGQDYHKVIPDLLEHLISRIKTELDPEILEYGIYTDSGPILERELASRAGLGWIGKNSCLINPTTGSFFFLAEILVNLPFEPDDPFDQDFCGTCNRCVENCPTGCILPNRTIDSNRCISFLTIENKADIPEELRPLLNGWVFGCDICQQVCPWNIRFSEKPFPNYFQSSKEVENFNIRDLLTIDQDKFKDYFAESPISRAKLYGLKRNLLAFAAYHFSDDLIDPIKHLIRNENNGELKKLAFWVFQKNDQEMEDFSIT